MVVTKTVTVFCGPQIASVTQVRAGDPAPDLLECERSHKETLCSHKSNTGSRKHAVPTAHSSFACRLQQRAGLKGSFRQFNKCIATRRPPQGRTRRPDCEWPRNYWGSHNTVTIMRVGRDPPHILVTETVTVFRRDSIAGAVLASAELCRRGTADRLYERARAAMPGQGSIERLKLRSTRTPRPFATNIGSVQLLLARRFGAGKVLANTPDAAGHTSGTRTGRDFI